MAATTTGARWPKPPPGLTAGQRRILAAVREHGPRTFTGRSRQAIRVLEKAGLVTASSRLSQASPGAERITVTAVEDKRGTADLEAKVMLQANERTRTMKVKVRLDETPAALAAGGREFTYEAPEGVAPGYRVEVPPFSYLPGSRKPMTGEITELGSDYDGEVRPVLRVLTGQAAPRLEIAWADVKAALEQAGGVAAYGSAAGL